MKEKLDLDALEARMHKLVNVAGASVQTTPETVLALIARIRELESASQPGGAELAFIARVAKQKPEKPDYWSSCSQCEHNISDAEDLVELRAAPSAGNGGAEEA